MAPTTFFIFYIARNKILSLESMNDAVKNVEYAVRGELALKAEALRVVSRGNIRRMTESTRKKGFRLFSKKRAIIDALVFVVGFGSEEASSLQACHWL
jgi:hypothetical protein